MLSTIARTATSSHRLTLFRELLDKLPPTCSHCLLHCRNSMLRPYNAGPGLAIGRLSRTLHGCLGYLRPWVVALGLRKSTKEVPKSSQSFKFTTSHTVYLVPSYLDESYNSLSFLAFRVQSKSLFSLVEASSRPYTRTIIHNKSQTSRKNALGGKDDTTSINTTAAKKDGLLSGKV